MANELGAGNGEGAKFATIVASATSLIIGLFFCCLIFIFHDTFGLIFSSTPDVLQEVDKLNLLLAFTILFNSIQPILSGMLHKLYTPFSLLLISFRFSIITYHYLILSKGIYYQHIFN